MLLWVLLKSGHDAQMATTDRWIGFRYPLVLAHQRGGCSSLADRGASADSRSDHPEVTKGQPRESAPDNAQRGQDGEQ